MGTKRRREILRKLAELIDSGERVLYIDECRFYQHGSRYRMWIPQRISIR